MKDMPAPTRFFKYNFIQIRQLFFAISEFVFCGAYEKSMGITRIKRYRRQNTEK